MIKKLRNKRVRIVGTGVTGLLAAIKAAESGAQVEMFEQNQEGAMFAARYRAASPAAFAQIVPGSMAPGPGRELAESAFDGWAKLAADAKLTPTAFYPCSWFACATGEADEAALSWYHGTTGKAWGTKQLTRRMIGRRKDCRPMRDTQCRFALLDPKSASVYPPECLKQLLGHVQRLKIKVHWDARVKQIEGHTAIVEIAGREEKVEADLWVVCSGNYDHLFPSEYRSRGFRLRQLQMAVTRVFAANKSLVDCFSSRSTTARYGFTGGAPSIEAVRAELPDALRRIDANVLFAPHPVDGGFILSCGDTHHDETEPMVAFRPGDFEVVVNESRRFLGAGWVPTLADIAHAYVGSYPYFADQGLFSEEPVLFCPAGAAAVCVMPTRGRGWTVAPAVANLALERGAELL